MTGLTGRDGRPARPGDLTPGATDARQARPGTDTGCDLTAPPPGTLEQRREWALCEAAGEAATSAGGDQPVVAVRLFAEGCAATALGGRFDDSAATERLATTLRELRHAAHRELVVDLGAVTTCPPRLVRTLARARIRYLVAGTRVAWHHVPDQLREQLHDGFAQSFSVLDGPSPAGGDGASRRAEPASRRRPR